MTTKSIPVTSLIVKLKAEGLTHRQIANQIGWKKDSVRTYLKRLRQTPVTEKQRRFLIRLGYNPEGFFKSQAILLIGSIIANAERNKKKKG